MKLGVRNFLLCGLMALIFIVLAKVALTKYPVPYLSEFVQSA